MTTLPPMPPTLDRAPFGNDPTYKGYLEGNGDWADANSDAVTWLADNHAAIRAALPAPGLETPRMLVLSTGHITAHTAAQLSARASGLRSRIPLSFAKGEYGWIIPIIEPGDANEEERWNGYPDLVAIRELAMAAGCTWIMLDRDGPVVPSIPTYDW